MEQSAKVPAPTRSGRAELCQLKICLDRVRRELNQAYTAFNMADDADWVESCVFEINALQARYNYLLKQAKCLEENR